MAPPSKIRPIGIILNGVTGRMGSNQHLVRSLLAIRREGGLRLSSGEVLMPEPILLGRNPDKLRALTLAHGLERMSTDLEDCLRDPFYEIYFDSQSTNLRGAAIGKALRAGKHIYCEKPVAGSFEEALDIARAAAVAGVKNGVVQDKLWLPGILKLRRLLELEFFGKILSVRGEFGYWVFDGTTQKAQRPSWNYRREDGGGIIADMFCHWRYLLDALAGPVRSVSCYGATHIPERLDENDSPYTCSAEDAAYSTMLCGSSVVCHFNSSWAVRVRRDDLLTIQIDGTRGSAVAGLRRCWVQPATSTPRFVWNPDAEGPSGEMAEGWDEVDPRIHYPNAFRAQWELFLRHVVAGEPFPWTLLEGARGVQLAELARRSWQEQRWIDVPELSL